MKVYLDDLRESPIGWTLTRTVCETLDLLKTGKVTELSLDHDLGYEKTGYDVLLWIEEEVYFNKMFKAPKIKIHSANESARRKMELAIQSIVRLQRVD